MISIDVNEAGEHLESLISRAESGEDIVITRDAVPVARMLAIVDPAPRPSA